MSTKHHVILGIFVALTVTAGANAALLAEDDFSGVAALPQQLDGTTTGSGWAAEWDQQALSGGSDFSVVNTSPLSISGIDNSSNYVNHLGGFDNAGRYFDTSASGPFSSFTSSPGGLIDQGVLYLSAMLRVDDNSNPSEDTRFLALHDNVSRAWREVGSGATQFVSMGSYDNSAWSLNIDGSQVASTVSPVVGEAVLLVMKIDLDNDVFSLFVDPTSNSEPLVADATGTFASDFGFRALAYEGGRSSLDRIRVADSFADAFGDTAVIPEPASIALLGLSTLCVFGRPRKN